MTSAYTSSGNTIKYEKIRLRSLAIARREAIANDLPTISNAMTSHLVASALLKQAKRLLLYAAFRTEPDILNTLLTVYSPNHRPIELPLYLPITEPHHRMHFHQLKTDFVHSKKSTEGEINLKPGRYGILEPHPSEHSILEVAAGDLLLLPGLLFDYKGHRIGYGKGYYDRFLAPSKKLLESGKSWAIGVVPNALVVDNLPSDSWDMAAGYLLTEQGLIATRQT